MTFDVAGWKRYRAVQQAELPVYSITAFCRGCEKGVAALIRPNDLTRLGRATVEVLLTGKSDITAYFAVGVIWPQPASTLVPLGLTPDIERIFREAEDGRARGNLTSAAIMFRKTVEAAVRQIDPTLKAGTLATRLRGLVTSGKLTTDMADWADHIRRLGNEAAHEDEEPAAADIDDLANLTRMTLVYLFEMPHRVAAMKAAVEATRTAAGGGS